MNNNGHNELLQPFTVATAPVQHYGRVKFWKGKWAIKCTPHVSIKLKRVFGKLYKGSMGLHVISATEENSRDLQWFMQRYPMAITDGDARAMSGLVDAHREAETFVQNFYNEKREVLSFPLALPPREYQSEAATFWLRMRGLLLADDVGLGKTVCAIAGFMEPKTLPALVVTLSVNMSMQWEREINRFAPHLRTSICKKGYPYKIRRPPDVFIMNYHKLAGWAETLAPIIKSVIYDECQELRRAESLKYSAAMHLAENTDYRIGLSATPIYNYGGEFFNVINALAPGKLGTAEEFLREWCDGWGYSTKYAKLQEPRAFGQYLRDNGLMLRRTRKEVKRELPPVTRVTQTIECDPDGLKEVSVACAELARLILKQGESERGEKMRASEEFSNKLRQATGIAKAPYVAAFVRLLVEQGESVVLYGWHRAVYDIWLDVLKDLNPRMFTGSESPTQKEASKNAFLAGESKILIVTLRAGAGLDGLQYGCKTCVFGELDWAPGIHDQCIGRIDRDGQPDPVLAYFLVSEEGSDPVVADVAGVKRAQLENARDPDAPLFEQVKADTDHIKKLAAAYLAQK